MNAKSHQLDLNPRINILRLLLVVASFILVSRLFYWQIINSTVLSKEAHLQRSSNQIIEPNRGKILANDGFALVDNQPIFTLFAYKPQLEVPVSDIATQLAPLTLDPAPKSATEAAKPYQLRLAQEQATLLTNLSDPDRSWIPLRSRLSLSTRDQIQALDITGLGFDRYQTRQYPEASMSAHLLGFLGKSDQGEDQGYFGLEGYYNVELTGRQGMLEQDTDAIGKPILIGSYKEKQVRDGRTLTTHIDRSIQSLVEEELRHAIEQYQAVSGEIMVMDPFTGAIIALSAWPQYDPANFIDYDPVSYKNPLIANTYEPGSTFKVITMAAAIEEAAITPSTRCDSTCDGPVQIGKYQISTWNNQYFPNQTMQEVLNRSDNTGMVFTAFRLGKDKFIDYISKFGIGELTGIDLQEETTARLRTSWGDIDLATSSFGQGIAVTGIQMLSAVSAIANGGELMQPQVVTSVTDDQTTMIEPVVRRRVISPATAAAVTEMMVNAAHHGEAQWAVLKNYRVAGKTGTAQVAIDGHYDEEKTIASFIGFAPADQPRFAMLVKLSEPQTSPWASETAAPTWFRLANDILINLGVPPGN